VAKNGWTDERRAKQSAAIHKWRPWAYSTGPRTAAGKAIIARNAYCGGQREWFRAFDVVMRVFRRNPGKETLSDCGSLTPREIEAARIVKTQGPSRPIAEKVRI
jgi:hypothetical protein